MALLILKILLLVCAAAILIPFFRDFAKNREDMSVKEKIIHCLIGAVTQFFDALGIGSFAPMLALYNLTKTVPSAEIPGTLNIGASIPVIVEALLFVNAIKMDVTTLVLMVIASAVGAAVGVVVNGKLPERGIKTTMAIGLLAAGILMLGGKLGWLPIGGTATALTGGKLVIGIVCNFVLGVLLPLGIGNYAPCMSIVYMLGMNPAVSFPLMMCSAAFGLTSSTIRLVKQGKYVRWASFMVIVAGSLGVVVAVELVKSLPLNALQWIVICVVLYTSGTLFKQVIGKKSPASGRTEAALQEQVETK